MKRIIGFGVLFLAAFFVLYAKQPQPKNTPLADPMSLSELMSGQTLPKPPDSTYAIFHGTQVVPPLLADVRQTSRVLGVTTIHDKRIEVDLTNQKVYAYEGNTKIFDFIVSTGKWGPTPTGTFYIWAKVKSQLMEGGSVADNTYYYLPNVPYVQFFYNDQVDKSMGYSFHGAYWHNNFGHPMSHGCINMRIEDAQKLYDWTNPVVTDPNAWSTLASDSDPGTEVVIYGIPPTE
jgi:lipoprotein-anchoring transpeptidase ErfK/SrfK